MEAAESSINSHHIQLQKWNQIRLIYSILCDEIDDMNELYLKI